MKTQQDFKNLIDTIKYPISDKLDPPNNLKPKSELHIKIVVIFTSIALTLASGYTTYQGLLEYTNNKVVPLFLTLGIQGLLFISSYKLGNYIKSFNFNAIFLIIWMTTASLSIFFSYTSLFNNIYSATERSQNRVIKSQELGTVIFNKISSIKPKISNTIDNKNDLYSSWKNKITLSMTKAQRDHEALVEKKEIKYTELKERFDNELKNGGTIYTNKNNIRAISKPGPGKISENYKKEMDDYFSKSLTPEKKKSTEIKSIVNTTLAAISRYDLSRSEKDLEIASTNCSKLKALISSSESSEISCSDNNSHEYFESLQNRRDLINSLEKKCNSNSITSNFDNNIAAIRLCIDVASNMGIETKSFSEMVKKFQIQEGKSTHIFTLSTNELLSRNNLAIATALLAAAIDILLLMCGILASNNTDFLVMKRSKELKSLSSYPLEIILETDTTPNESDSPKIKRMKQIIRKSVYIEEYALQSFPMTIPMSEIKNIGMQKEIGTLFSMNLARTFKKNDGISLRTNLILWMCEQITQSNIKSH